jgi:zinc protease
MVCFPTFWLLTKLRPSHLGTALVWPVLLGWFISVGVAGPAVAAVERLGISPNSSGDRISVRASRASVPMLVAGGSLGGSSARWRLGDPTVRRLANGLTVAVLEARSAPVVSVQMWYGVGSRHEGPRTNGISHLLEHLMFAGTRDRPVQFGYLFDALGSESNAYTGYDTTGYVNMAPRDRLEALLTLEADRLVNLRLSAADLAKEVRVVTAEIEGYGDDPAYRLDRAVMAAAFPERPMGLPVGGTVAALQGLTVADLRRYYERFYRPDNGVLVVVGDVDGAAAIAAAERIFGGIAPRAIAELDEKLEPEPEPDTQESLPGPPRPVRSSPQIVTLREAGGGSPLLSLTFPLPPLDRRDRAALAVLDGLVAAGAEAPLMALVDGGAATSVETDQFHGRDGGWYQVLAAVPPGQLDRVQGAVLGAIAAVASGERAIAGPALGRAKRQARLRLLLPVEDLTGRAMGIAEDCLSLGDCRDRQGLLDAIEAVTAAQVQQIARTHLSPERATLGRFEPIAAPATAATGEDPPNRPRPGGASRPPVHAPEAYRPAERPANLAALVPPLVDDRAIAATPLNAATANQPTGAPHAFTLANGLRVVLLPDRALPTVTLRGHVQAGRQHDPGDRAGLADLVAAALLDPDDLRQGLNAAAIDLSASAYREGTLIGGRALPEETATLLALLSQALQRPQFAADRLDRLRQQARADLQLQLDDPLYVAQRQLQQAIYPAGHPFHGFATADSLDRVTGQDLMAFHRRHYRPAGTVLALVGPFDPVVVRRQVQTLFGPWQVAEAPPAEELTPLAPLPPHTIWHHTVLPGKAQTVTLMGYPGIDRRDRRHDAAVVLNQILGGDTLTSRLGREIRDRQGMAYGIFSSFQMGQHAGPFAIEMQTAPEHTFTAIQTALNILQTLRDRGVTAEEVASAKQTLTSRYPVRLAHPDALADHWVMALAYGLEGETPLDFTRRIEAVTVSQVQNAVRELLHPDHMTIISAGPPLPPKPPLRDRAAAITPTTYPIETVP